MPFIDYQDTKIYYQLAGEGAPALIFVHGWSCNHTAWVSQFHHFSKNHLVITLDLAGHGNSKSERILWDMENFARDVIAVYEGLGINEVILIGHSMGGAVILEAARLIGANVKGLIGVDSIVYSTYSEIPNDQVNIIIQSFENDFVNNVKDIVLNFLPKNVDRDLYHKIATMMSSAPISVAIPSIRAFLVWDYRKPLTNLQAPLTCICSKDRTSEINFDEFNDLFKIRTIPNVGHFLMMEDALAFNRELEFVINEINMGEK